MHRINLKRHLPYESGQLLDLASDVQNYGRFIQWVKAVRIWNKSIDGKEFDAELMIGYKNFRIPFSTHVTIDINNKQIRTQNIETKSSGFLGLKSPIKYLDCVWGFGEDENGSVINLTINLDFRDVFIGAIVGANLDKVSGKLVNAFEAEAQKRFRPINV